MYVGKLNTKNMPTQFESMIFLFGVQWQKQAFLMTHVLETLFVAVFFVIRQYT